MSKSVQPARVSFFRSDILTKLVLQTRRSPCFRIGCHRKSSVLDQHRNQVGVFGSLTPCGTSGGLGSGKNVCLSSHRKTRGSYGPCFTVCNFNFDKLRLGIALILFNKCINFFIRILKEIGRHLLNIPYLNSLKFLMTIIKYLQMVAEFFLYSDRNSGLKNIFILNAKYLE